jgi:hypothetical protein
VAIIERVVGESRREVNVDGWTEYNCPNCAAEKGVAKDDKYNLCVNYIGGYCHCWRCQWSGKLSRLVRTFGGDNLLHDYYNEIQTIKNAKEFQFRKFGEIVNDTLVDIENIVELPKDYKVIDASEPLCNSAYEYLQGRGITDDLIDRYKIGYVNHYGDYKFRDRVIIPSYDSFGDLNYWVGRDYTGTNKYRYANPQIPKTKFIFNEGLVDWYDDITLVEGVFDHIAVPNSIPLLGKMLKKDYVLYEVLNTKAKANVNIMLDDDALEYAIKMYKFLDSGELCGRIRLIRSPRGYDAALIYQKYGKNGIINIVKQAEKLML